MQRLDHLEWLGIDCLWLLPFYTSPLRDGGYDISDFFTIQPVYGQLADAVELVEEAHRRGMRVVADLVVNHTSDQHPWFQESRQDAHQPEGRLVRVGRRRPALERGPDHLPRHRAVELDAGTRSASSTTGTASSTTSPTSTTTTPRSQTAMLDVVRFWLDIGLDGFRLDAVPYLYERDGTNGENLPETHAFLRRLRTRDRRLATRARCCWPRPTSGRATSCSTSATATSATCASTSR